MSAVSGIKRFSRYAKNTTPENVDSYMSIIEEMDDKLNRLFALTNKILPKHHTAHQKITRLVCLLNQIKEDSNNIRPLYIPTETEIIEDADDENIDTATPDTPTLSN